jgi:hypothetical protein
MVVSLFFYGSKLIPNGEKGAPFIPASRDGMPGSEKAAKGQERPLALSEI